MNDKNGAFFSRKNSQMERFRSSSSCFQRQNTTFDDEFLPIDVEPLCPQSSEEDLYRRESTNSVDIPLTFVELMRKIYRRCSKSQSSVKIRPKIDLIIDQPVKAEAKKRISDRILTILPHENTFSELFFPRRSIPVDSSMIEKIVVGVRSMDTALTSRITFLEIENVQNPLTIDSILAENRLCGRFTLSRSDSIILSRLIRSLFERQQKSEFATSISKFEFPSKFADLFKFIEKLRQFREKISFFFLIKFWSKVEFVFLSVPNDEVSSTIRKTFLSQLNERSKTKQINVNDLRALNTQISFNDDDLPKTIDSNVVKRFYLDFHEKNDIDDRLRKVTATIVRSTQVFRLDS